MTSDTENTHRLAILFSGEGSNMEAIIQALHQKPLSSGQIIISSVITNNPNAGGIARAKRLGVPCHVVDHRSFSQREAFDLALTEMIAPYDPTLVILAGFMRILTPVFTQRFRTINIHPSLLPLFKGAHGIKESYNSSMQVAGVTVHHVNEELDGGEIIMQKAIEKIPGEDFAEFKSRIHALEHRLYPAAILKILEQN